MMNVEEGCNATPSWVGETKWKEQCKSVGQLKLKRV